MSAVEALCAKDEELSRAINDLREKSEGNSAGIRTKEYTNVDKNQMNLWAAMRLQFSKRRSTISTT
jgi:hypothetical protein